MGLANLVPGVSGGTMILALGLYDRFIGAVAEVTRLRPSRQTLVFLGLFGAALVVAVAALAGLAVWSVRFHRWAAYSLFIGMTLGGVPQLARVVRPFSVGMLAAVLGGMAVMVGVVFLLRGTALPHTPLVFLTIGTLAASSMILPGISGSYILLIFGLYDVVIGCLRPREFLDDVGGSLAILVPVGIGVVIGIGALSNVLKVLLVRFERSTHAALLGLLLGSVLGLWPFQDAVHPDLVTKPQVKAVEALLDGADVATVSAEFGLQLDEAKAAALRARYAGSSRGDLKLLGLQLDTYRPEATRVVLSMLLLVGGFVVTRRLSGDEAGAAPA
jgi:putative membrane protein